MSAVGHSIPEAARLHIRISDSDDESDGEQQRDKVIIAENKERPTIPEHKESTDDLRQLAKTAQATAEAVIRINDAMNNQDSLSTGPMVSGQDDVGAGDNISNTMQQPQQQPQVYYVPQIYACPAAASYTTDGQTATTEMAQNLIPAQQASQTSMYQVPQLSIPHIPAGTVLYQVPQSPMPSNQVIYQMPTLPPTNYQTVMYQVPPVQYTHQQADNEDHQTTAKQECQQCFFEERYNSGDAGGRERRSFTIGDFIRTSTPEMVYPTVYVSPAGLLTVLLKHDVAVEMTLDKTIRVVNHKHKAVAATNSKGTASCIYHGVAKVYQDATRCDAECFLPSRQLSITTESLKFAYGLNHCYKLNNKSYEFTIAYPSFRDVSQDMSVSLLFSSKQYGPHLIDAYQEVANSARYRRHKNGATTVYINGTKIYQYEKGDVVVYSGKRYIRVSPTFGSMMVGTHYVEMLLENTHTLKVRRGDYRFKVTDDLIVMSDGYMECGMDKNKQVFCQLEMLLVRTIIDNRQPCDVSCTGSREAYITEENQPKPLPAITCQTYEPCLQPPHPFLQLMYDRYFRRQTGWWRRRGRSHYTIDLEKAIRLAKDEYEKKQKEQAKQIPAITMDSESTKEKGNDTKKNERPRETENRKIAVVSITEAVQKLIDSRQKAPGNDIKMQSIKNKSEIVVLRESEAAPRLWSSIVISHERSAVSKKENEVKATSDAKSTERQSIKRVTIDPVPRIGTFGNGKEREFVKRDKKNMSENSWRRKNNEYDNVESTSREFRRDQRPDVHENSSRSSHLKQVSKREDHRKSAESNKPNKNDKQNHNRHSARQEFSKDDRVTSRSPKNKNRKTLKSNGRAVSNDKHCDKRATDQRSDHVHPSREGGDRIKGKSKIKTNGEPAEAVKDTQRPRLAVNKKTSLNTEKLGTCKEQGEQPRAPQVTRPSEMKLSLKDKISPREKVISPRNTRSPRGLGKVTKKRSPREPNRVSPRERHSDPPKPRERRNKKKRATRHYTDAPENKSETTQKENVSPNDAREAVQSNQAAVRSEDAVNIATDLVNHIVAEAMKIVEKTNHVSDTKKDEGQKLEKAASVVLKHVFYIVCQKWKLYYSHLQNTQHTDTDKEKVHVVSQPQEAMNSLELAQEPRHTNSNRTVRKSSDVIDNTKASKTVGNDPTPRTKCDQEQEVGPTISSLSSDDETLTEEIVYHVVNSTLSADNLERMSRSKVPKKKPLHSQPVVNKSEPNVCLKEGQHLRSTKSEVMTSSTSGSMELPHGIEAQNNSEGNITQKTACRLKATQKTTPKLKVNIPTINIATNEKGSGESFEASARKIETTVSAQNQMS